MSTRFELAETRGVLTALAVHEPEAHASPERLYRLLLEIRIQLVHVTETLADGKAVVRLSVCELDGAPIRRARLRTVVEALGRVFVPKSAASPVLAPTAERGPPRAA
jgi:hypothetical protein